MSRGLYFAYIKAWRKENPASEYELTPGAALMLRAIIDEINAQFWPTTPIRIENQYFMNTCNFKNRETIRRYRNQLIDKGLISWHKDAANNKKAGFYALTWTPEEVNKELEKTMRHKYVTQAPFKLRIVKGL